MASSRRSTRERKPNPRYSSHAFTTFEHLEEDGIFQDTDGVDEHDKSPRRATDRGGRDNDKDFLHDQPSVHSESGDSAAYEDGDGHDNLSELRDGNPDCPPSQFRQLLTWMKEIGCDKRDECGDGSGPLSSSIPFQKFSQYLSLASESGELDEINRYNESHDSHFDDLTIPRRRLGLSPFSKDRDPTVSACEWYLGRGGRAFALANQTTAELVSEEFNRLYCSPAETRHVLLGPVTCPTIFGVHPGQAIGLNEPFPDKPGTEKHHGWLLNLGQHVQTLAWSYRKDGQRQYLAIASHNRQVQDENVSLRARQSTPGSSPARSTIEIWEFFRAEYGQVPGNPAARVDTGRKPLRRLVLGLDIGRIKSIKWCPMEPDTSKDNSSNEVHVGLLAIVSTDGRVRVLDVGFPDTHPDTTYRRVLFPAFGGGVPLVDCTCVTWVDSSSLAAGCSDGHVVLWDLEAALSESRSAQPENNFSIQASQFLGATSFITRIESLLPSRPGFVLIATVGGSLHLAQLSNPTADNIKSTSSKHGSAFFVWHDFLQHAVGTPDPYEARGYYMARFGPGNLLCRLPSPARCGAASRMHSSVVVGCADGSSVVFNPMRRVFAPDDHADKDHRWTWFRHEWRAARFAEDFAGGLSRITTGFAIEGSGGEDELGHDPAIRSRFAADGTRFASIFEQKSAVTAAEWNPNQCAGGWAAAGMGDGLVIVEDLCHG